MRLAARSLSGTVSIHVFVLSQVEHLIPELFSIFRYHGIEYPWIMKRAGRSDSISCKFDNLIEARGTGAPAEYAAQEVKVASRREEVPSFLFSRFRGVSSSTIYPFYMTTILSY